MERRFYEVFGAYNVGIIIYVVTTFIFMLFLNHLNHELLRLQDAGQNAFQLIQYNNYRPVFSFFIALFLGLGGIVLAVLFVRKGVEFISSIGEIIYLVSIVIIIVVMIVFLVKLITIPILKIIFSVVVVGIGVLYGISQSNY